MALKTKTLARPSPSSTAKNVRTTLILPVPIDKNVEAFSAKEGLSKNAAFLKLLENGLVASGLQPKRIPKIVVEY